MKTNGALSIITITLLLAVTADATTVTEERPSRSTHVREETADITKALQLDETGAKAINCALDLLVEFSAAGDLVTVDYKAHKGDDSVHVAEQVYSSLKEALERDEWGSRTYLVTEFLQHYFEPLHALTRKISRSEMTRSQKPKNLQDIEVLLYGERSLNSKITLLQKAIKKDGPFLSKEKKRIQIEKVALEIQSCRVAIAKCTVELPRVLASLNTDYANLNKIQRLISDQINVLDYIEANAPHLANPHEEIGLLIAKKKSDLSATRTSILAMMSQTEKLLAVINQVGSDSQQINSSAMRQEIINAAAHGFYISKIIHDNFGIAADTTAEEKPKWLSAGFSGLTNFSEAPPFGDAKVNALAQMIAQKEKPTIEDLNRLWALLSGKQQAISLWVLRLKELPNEEAHFNQTFTFINSACGNSAALEEAFLKSPLGQVLLDSLRRMPTARASKFFNKLNFMNHFPLISRAILDFAPEELANALRRESGLALVETKSVAAKPANVLSDYPSILLAAQTGGDTLANMTLIFDSLKNVELSQEQYLKLIDSLTPTRLGNNPAGTTSQVIDQLISSNFHLLYPSWTYDAKYDIIAFGLSRIRRSSMDKGQWITGASTKIHSLLDKLAPGWRGAEINGLKYVESPITVGINKAGDMALDAEKMAENEMAQHYKTFNDIKPLIAALGTNLNWSYEIYNALKSVELSQQDFLTLAKSLNENTAKPSRTDVGQIYRAVQEQTGLSLSHWQELKVPEDMNIQIIFRALQRVKTQDLDRTQWLTDASTVVRPFIAKFLELQRPIGSSEEFTFAYEATTGLFTRMINKAGLTPKAGGDATSSNATPSGGQL